MTYYSTGEYFDDELRNYLDREDNTEEFDIDLVTNVKFDDVDPMDAPDFCDAYIESADYKDRELTSDEINMIHHEYRIWMNEKINEQFFSEGF